MTLTYAKGTNRFWEPELLFHSYTPNGFGTGNFREYLDLCEEAYTLMADIEKLYFRDLEGYPQVFSNPQATLAHDFIPYRPYQATSVRAIRKSL